MLKEKLLLIIPIVVVLAYVFAFVSFDQSSNDETETKIIEHVDVVMPTKVSRPGCENDDICYIPSEITVEKGQQVTWMNEDSAFHSVTSGFYDSPTNLFDSGYLDPYESFSFTFNESGTFDYFCTLHPWMEGQVIVE